MLEGLIYRRADFLITEARSGVKKPDEAVTKVLRSLSNYLTVGSDGSSDKVKKLNPNMSQAAKELRDRLSPVEWHKQTTNEHQLELKIVWKYIVHNALTLTPKDLCAYMRRYPYVTITKDENDVLRKVKDFTSPEDRYFKASIKTVKLE
jgi:hypothetical protein